MRIGLGRFGRALCVGIFLCGCNQQTPSEMPSAPNVPDQVGTEVTFFVAGDTHFGQLGMSDENQKIIDAMNTLPGKHWPNAWGGTIPEPFGVLICGDMTEHGLPHEWDMFQDAYGTTGTEGKLRFATYIVPGNHDRQPIDGTQQCERRVTQRHGGAHYSWNVQDVRFIALGTYPDAEALAYLKKDLAIAGTKTPIVLFWHYNLTGPWSDSWSDEEKQAFKKTIEGHNIVAIFNGHWHRPGYLPWEGYRSFLTGSPKHSGHTFFVVQITDDHLRVAGYFWDGEMDHNRRFMLLHEFPL